MQTDKKYWLKGGIVGIIVNLSYTIYMIFTINPGDRLGIIFATIHNVFGRILIAPFYRGISIYADFVAALITGFVVGIILGWIYGKIKSRKQ